MSEARPRFAYTARQGCSRRAFLGGLLAAGVAACGSPDTVPVGSAERADGEFPDALPRYADDYGNWSRELICEGLDTCAPRTPEQVVDVINWAARNGRAVRARGAMHNWSPLTVSPDTTAETPVTLLDMPAYLNRMEMTRIGGLPAVRTETGARMEDLLAFLETQGYGFTAVPAVGVISVGGALAIDGHGAAVPASGEIRQPGQTYGSLSNRVLALTAVVWDAQMGRYALRAFARSEPEIGALLVHLGRALLTEVTLLVEPLQYLRCVSHTGIPARELFSSSGGGRDLASFLDASGRIEAIWYPFTEYPWLKVWTPSPIRPPLSREVSRPYNYPFSDNLPAAVVDLAQQLVTGRPEVAPLFGQLMYDVSVAGLTASAAFDLWGPSKNTLLFIKPSTLRITELSYAVITRRDRVQQVVSEFAAQYQALLAAYRAQGRYPVNMPVEIRVSGLDHAADTGLPDAQPALLSALAPRADHADWDTAVWLSILTLPGTPERNAFFREIEQWLLGHYAGSYACARPEWSKGWAYTEQAAWSDVAMLRETIPQAHRDGRGADAGWDAAMRQLRACDPRAIYRNALLDLLG